MWAGATFARGSVVASAIGAVVLRPGTILFVQYADCEALDDLAPKCVEIANENHAQPKKGNG
jgi:hypothetical protein